MKRASAIASVLWAIAIASGSCSGDEGSSVARDAGSDARSTALDAGAKAPSLDASADAAASFTPVGWTPLTGFDPSCPMSIAQSPDKFPPPNAWEPCDARVQGADGGGLSCQQIADNWGSGGAPGLMPIGPVASAYVDHTTQSVTLTVPRFAPNGLFYVVADADGPVRQAVYTTSPQCTLDAFASVSASNAIYEIDEMSADLKTIVLAGALGGPLGSPRILRSYNNVNSLGYTAGATAFAEIGAAGFDTGAWTDGHKLATLGTAAPGQVGELQFQGDTLFFGVSDLNYGRVQMYTAAGGVVDFISYGDVTTNYAADFGTDGTDMVWTEASGHPGGDTNPWTTIANYTASFTTDPGSVTKRRLRSQSTYGLGTMPFVVGCGYAAHQTSDTDGTGFRVIRLSDGQSWRLVSSSPLAWTAPIAVTCSEVFVNFNFGSGKTNLARIRLDSLGTGDAPD